ncbi:MAG: antibiotic biosynthesis monooxygenase [Rhodobacteraceae bacterium]|jgi:quinol monooxygenase YgiN|nr:antibiotic biosynthesis monooxygenase [Paracoccaceae bacterium]
MPRIALVGTLRCRNAAEAGIVRTHLPEHVRLSRAEPGCLKFEVTQDDDPLIWQVSECFASAADFEAHQARVKASEWGLATQGIARDYRIEAQD